MNVDAVGGQLSKRGRLAVEELSLSRQRRVFPTALFALELKSLTVLSHWLQIGNVEGEVVASR